jgi:hypothetical protein
MRLRKMSHTIYIARIILRTLSALFGSQFMLPTETSVTFIGACANEIIRRNNSGVFFNKGKEWGHVRIKFWNFMKTFENFIIFNFSWKFGNFWKHWNFHKFFWIFWKFWNLKLFENFELIKKNIFYKLKIFKFWNNEFFLI